MAYGQSILSNIPADWVVTNGELTSSTMTLHANGSALLNVTIDMIDKLPETAEVTVVAGAYSINNRVEVIAVLHDNTYVAHTLPIVDVSNGIYKTIIDFPGEDYSSFVFKISSKEGVEITEWSMATPVSADYTEVIDGVKQEIPKLLWDYNTLEFQIGQEECTVGMISAKLSKNGDLQGHLQINCTASEDSVIVVRIFDNEIQELYSPIEFVVKRGRNSLGIPHSYIGRKIGIHNFLVTMQVKTGTVTVETRGFLYTIDGGYLAQRILDVGYEVHDITIKQLPTDMDPSEIYAVCIDDGKALIRKRVYNEEVVVAWVPEYIIEDAVKACIEFSGLWILRDGEIGFTLETDEQPYVMWIDTTGVLWSQHGPDVTTKFQMATGVSYMSCCMSYNYESDIQYDQGLMCVYIKAGIVYYKNLCRQDLIGTMLWSAEREIISLGSGNTLVSVARLNDYRCAINTINSKSQWLISDRGYVGQAARPEHLYTTLKDLVLGVEYASITTTEVDLIPECLNMSSSVAANPVDILWSGTSVPTISSFSIVDSYWVAAKQFKLICSHKIILYPGYLHNIKAYALNNAVEIIEITGSGSYEVTVTIAESIPSLAALDISIGGDMSTKYYALDNYKKTIPGMTYSVLSSVFRKTESLAITQQAAQINQIAFATIKETEMPTLSDSLSVTLSSPTLNTLILTQYGTTPV